MKTLYMHIGHGKTGTSYVQSAFAQTSDRLLTGGIYYPLSDLILSAPDINSVSFGNALLASGRSVLKSYECMERWLQNLDGVEENSVLASSEDMFYDLPAWLDDTDRLTNMKTLESLCRSAGFAKVNILIGVRDPITFAASFWQQEVKAAGYQHELEEHVNRFGHGHLRTAANICRQISESNFFYVRVFNYETHKRNILNVFEDWLQLAPSLLVRPKEQISNRSLSFGELELQKALNGLVANGAFLGSRLVYELPLIKADHHVLSPETARALWAQAEDDIATINSFLPPQEALVFTEPAGPPPPDDYTFNADQLALIARIIAEKHNAVEDLTRQLAESPKIPPEVAAELDALKSALAEQREPVIPPEVTAELETLQAALRRAWRDPLPHLWAAYAKKVRSGLRRWRR